MKPLLLAAGVAVVLAVILFAGLRLGYIPWPWTSSTVSQTPATPQPVDESTPAPAASANTDTDTVETAGNATWIAACYDGKTLQYSQTIGGKGFLYLDVGEGDYQRIALIQNSYNGNVICSVDDSVVPPGGEHFLKVCADATNNIITLKYTDPVKKKLLIDDAAPYCKAAVTVH